jgi:hypothetical protein
MKRGASLPWDSVTAPMFGTSISVDSRNTSAQQPED